MKNFLSFINPFSETYYVKSLLVGGYLIQYRKKILGFTYRLQTTTAENATEVGNIISDHMHGRVKNVG